MKKKGLNAIFYKFRSKIYLRKKNFGYFRREKTGSFVLPKMYIGSSSDEALCVYSAFIALSALSCLKLLSHENS